MAFDYIDFSDSLESLNICGEISIKIPKDEATRYMGIKNTSDAQTDALLEKAIPLTEAAISPKYILKALPLAVLSDRALISEHEFKSLGLSTHLKGAKRCVILAATLGLDLDRLITRLLKTDLALAYCVSSCGSAAVEALCDTVCEGLKKKASESGFFLTERFSPGYSDLSLSCQRDIFSLTDCTKLIGIYLSSESMMLPSKSVTAIMGIIKKT